MKKQNYYSDMKGQTPSTTKALIKKENFSNVSNALTPNRKYWLKTFAKLAFELVFITWAVFTLVFILVNAIPGDPQIVTDAVANKASPETIDALREMYNLNDPGIVRYFKAIGDALSGTFGYSGTYGVEVSSIMWPKIGLSMQIGFFAIAFSILLGIPLGIFIARRDTNSSDLLAAVAAVIAFAIPSFVIALIFLFINSLLGLPIIFEYQNFYMILLPAIVIAIPVGFGYSRYLRSSIRNEYRQQYVALARVKGVSESKLLWSHIIKPSLYPIATYFPFVVTGAMFGSIAVERVFAIPGAGDMLVSAALEKDQNVLLGISTMYTIVVIFAFFVRDLILQAIDPRIRTK